jgi:signal transduction histidine kinase
MRMWPASLAGRVALLLVAGLVATYGLTLWSAMRAQAAQGDAMMMDYLARDVGSALRLLERLPAGERAEWLPLLARPHYRWLAQPPAAGRAGAEAQALAAALAASLGPSRVTGVAPGAGAGWQVGLRLADGQTLTLEVERPQRRLPADVLFRLGLQALLLAGCVLLIARLVTRPLDTLAAAATRLGEDPQAPPLPEQGPSELRRAAAAFNTMQRRLAEQTAERIAERVQILAAVSHDLQSPITRLRLRSELLPDDGPGGLRARLQSDLHEMQQLIDSGLAYARSAHAALEPARPVDVAALLDAIACDRADAGQPVAWLPGDPCVLPTRPQALHRMVGNLLDNALKFAGHAELSLEREGDAVLIAVRDRGPGVAPERLADVQRPFVRGEPSRNRDTGGSGLGLAIVQRLAEGIGAHFELRPREGGGLEALLRLPRAPAAQAQISSANSPVRVGAASKP